MKNITKFLSLFAITFLVTATTFAAVSTGQFKIRYVGSATSPGGIAFNTTVDRTTIYIEDPGYPIHAPWESPGLNGVGSPVKNGPAVVAIPQGPGATGYTAWSSFILKDLKFRKGGTTFYTLTPTEIANLEYVGDSINVTTPWDTYKLELSWDGDDTLLTITHLF